MTVLLSPNQVGIIYIIAAISGNNDNILVNVYIETKVYIRIKIIKNSKFDKILFFSFNAIKVYLSIASVLVIHRYKHLTLNNELN